MLRVQIAGDRRRSNMVLVMILHATKTLRDRLRPALLHPGAVPNQGSNPLGPWYATALMWRPQMALFVNAATLFPILVPLAPAAGLLSRLPNAIAAALEAQEVPSLVLSAEVKAARHVVVAATGNRSVLGVMNEFAHLGRLYLRDGLHLDDIARALSEVPCGPLYKTWVTPARALEAAVAPGR